LTDSLPTLAFIGGTGAEGKGLALRYALAGHPVIIGSRAADRAAAVAADLNQTPGLARISGAANLTAASAASIIFLTVPYTAQADTLPALAAAVTGKLVISAVVPMAFEGGRPAVLAVPEGSAAQQAVALLPGARVAAAFHHLSARHLADLPHPMEGDVLVCADDAAAKQETLALVAAVTGLRGVDAGGLTNARTVEAMTAVLLSINRRYKINAGLRVVGL